MPLKKLKTGKKVVPVAEDNPDIPSIATATPSHEEWRDDEDASSQDMISPTQELEEELLIF